MLYYFGTKNADGIAHVIGVQAIKEEEVMKGVIVATDQFNYLLAGNTTKYGCCRG